MTDFHQELYEYYSTDTYLFTEFKHLDFTSDKSYSLVLSNEQHTKTFSIPSLEDRLKSFMAGLSLVGNGLEDKNNLIISWDLKSIISYFSYKSRCNFSLNGNVLDLKILESYVGLDLEKPKNYNEAKLRLRNLVSNYDWKSIYKIYQQVYLPLTHVIPQIETTGLSDKFAKKRVFPYYEIDGQINGRMKCSSVYLNSFNPHTLSIENKEHLAPSFFDYHFVSLDYKHMEVSVLQWLSKDNCMKQLLETDDDLYCSIWRTLFNKDCNDEYRQICKNFFLPIIYGLGVDGLMKKMNWTKDVADYVFDKLNTKFKDAVDWIKTQQNSMSSNNTYADYFGRIRSFDNAYKIRNFCIQSPASLICLHKLTKLNKAIENTAKICMHVHDGYHLICHRQNLIKTVDISKKVLEQEEDLYPGLKLKVSLKYGTNLNNMKGEDYD